jgi:hypothetical protein
MVEANVSRQIRVTLYSPEEDRIERVLPGLREAHRFTLNTLPPFLRFYTRIKDHEIFDYKKEAKSLRATVRHRLVQDLPNATEQMRHDLDLIFGIVADVADELAEAKANLDEAGLNLALNSSDKFQFSYEETQREFETKMSEFRTHFRGADEFGKHLYDRRCALDRRLEVYKREIERRMPTQRD